MTENQNRNKNKSKNSWKYDVAHTYWMQSWHKDNDHASKNAQTPHNIHSSLSQTQSPDQPTSISLFSFKYI